MNDYIIGWACSKCSCSNRDSFFFTAGPMCEKCEADFRWDDLLDAEDMRIANAYFKDYLAQHTACLPR